MPVRELACLRLKNGQPITAPANEDTLRKLREGIPEQARYTNSPTHVLSQIEDPSVFYILGKWASVSRHVDEWIPSETNQAIMGGLAADVELVFLEHLDIPSSDATGNQEERPLKADVVAIGRYFLSDGDKEAFQRTFYETKHHLEEFNGGKGIWGAWREDKDVGEEGDSKEEFVLFSGWENVEKHMKFAESEGFKEFARIKAFLQGAEIRHATPVFSEHP
jgi:heme-degrading monooxygenase HmoA